MSYYIEVKGANYLADSGISVVDLSNKQVAEDLYQATTYDIKRYKDRMHNEAEHKLESFVRLTAQNLMAKWWKYWIEKETPKDEMFVNIHVTIGKYIKHTKDIFKDEEEDATNKAEELFRNIRFICRAMKNCDSLDKFNEMYYHYEELLDSYIDNVMKIVKCRIGIMYFNTLEQG